MKLLSAFQLLVVGVVRVLLESKGNIITFSILYPFLHFFIYLKFIFWSLYGSMHALVRVQCRKMVQLTTCHPFRLCWFHLASVSAFVPYSFTCRAYNSRRTYRFRAVSHSRITCVAIYLRGKEEQKCIELIIPTLSDVCQILKDFHIPRFQAKGMRV